MLLSLPSLSFSAYQSLVTLLFLSLHGCLMAIVCFGCDLIGRETKFWLYVQVVDDICCCFCLTIIVLDSQIMEWFTSQIPCWSAKKKKNRLHICLLACFCGFRSGDFMFVVDIREWSFGFFVEFVAVLFVSLKIEQHTFLLKENKLLLA